MSNDVYANGMEVSCKAAAGKSICAFPDVCFTPPQTPATPPGVPIPYPNTGMASDATDGSKTVNVSGQEVMLKDKSYFKSSTGDEAGSAPKKGIMTSANKGKVYFTAWSMDVKFEGENVVRNFDLTTHNHNPAGGNGPPWLYKDNAIVPKNRTECQELASDLNKERSDLPDQMQRIHERSPAGEAEADPATLAVGKVFGVGGGKVRAHSMVAHSKIMKGKKYRRYSKGIKRHAQSNVKQCGTNEPFKYESNAAHPKQGHAEAKIIEAWFRSGGAGRLVLNVSRPVCPDCARLIKAVNCHPKGGKNCNKIKVCDNRQGDESKQALKC